MDRMTEEERATLRQRLPSCVDERAWTAVWAEIDAQAQRIVALEAALREARMHIKNGKRVVGFGPSTDFIDAALAGKATLPPDLERKVGERLADTLPRSAWYRVGDAPTPRHRGTRRPKEPTSALAGEAKTETHDPDVRAEPCGAVCGGERCALPEGHTVPHRVGGLWWTSPDGRGGGRGEARPHQRRGLPMSNDAASRARKFVGCICTHKTGTCPACDLTAALAAEYQRGRQEMWDAMSADVSAAKESYRALMQETTRQLARARACACQDAERTEVAA